MQKDYKMFPPKINWENIDWSTRRPQMDFPVQVYYYLGIKDIPRIICLSWNILSSR